jgi:hypothetical protein
MSVEQQLATDRLNIASSATNLQDNTHMYDQNNGHTIQIASKNGQPFGLVSDNKKRLIVMQKHAHTFSVVHTVQQQQAVQCRTRVTR